ncbi:MAG: hypothetical protein CMJ39_02100 [Phycisphaerae bacterium]|nr:hypothetical protein [Phycisphaerae bacterium]
MSAPASTLVDSHSTYPGGRFKAWVAWSMPALFFLYEFLIRVAPGVIEGDLQKDFNATPGDIGLNMSLYYYAYAPMQLVVGVLLDRMGGRRPLAIASLVCGGGCVLFAAASSVEGLGYGRFLMGFGSAFAYVGTVYVASIWFPGRRIALLSGVTAALGMLGAVTAEAFLSVLLESVTWREAFNIFAGSAVVMALLMALLIPRSPESHVQRVKEARLEHGSGLLSGYRCVLRSRQTWMLGIVTALVYLPIGTFAALWGDRYLQVVMGFSEDDAGPVVSLMFIGLAIAGPIIGWLSDSTGRRAIYLKIGTLLALVCSSALLIMPSSADWLVYVLLLLLGASAGAIVVAFPLAMEHNPHHSRGTAMTFVNFMQMILAGVGQWVVGMLLDDDLKQGASQSSLDASDFRTAFVILPVCLIMGAMIAFFLRDPVSDTTEATAASALPLAD